MKIILLLLSLVAMSSTAWGATPETVSCKLSNASAALPNWYALIEIGAKGIKPVAVESDGVSQKATEQFPTRDVLAYEAANLPNVVQAVCEVITEIQHKYGDLPIYLVGSSGISQVSHKPDLEEMLNKATGKKIEFISAEQEIVYLSKGIWKDLPLKRRCDSSLVDIGSGNVKGGYIQECNPNKIVAVEKFKAFNVDDYGVAAFTKKAQELAGTDNIEYSAATEIVRKQFEATLMFQLKDNIELTASKKRFYLVGGAAWALDTLLCLDCEQYASRSETGDQHKFTVIKASDVEEFYNFVSTSGEKICDPNFVNPYLTRNLDTNTQTKRDTDKVNKQIEQIGKVCSKFSVKKAKNELLSAAEILRVIVKTLGINQARNLFFMQDNLYTWSQEYLLEKIKSGDVAEKNLKSLLNWHLVGEQKSQGIGGIALIDDQNLLVVHDGKKPEYPRLSIITLNKNENPILKQQGWCDMEHLPIDLEALTAIPGYKKDFLVLESKGTVTRIRFESNTCKVTAHFDLPTATSESNIESLALHCFKKKFCVLAWAERGNENIPAKMSWAEFDVDSNKINQLADGLFEFNASYPIEQRRSISDMAINNNGMVWVSAVSDPGDEGPFQSAIYKLGKFRANKHIIVWLPEKEAEQVMKFENENIKIEGLVFNKGLLYMGTDDENKGSKIAEKLIQ